VTASAQRLARELAADPARLDYELKLARLLDQSGSRDDAIRHALHVQRCAEDESLVDQAETLLTAMGAAAQIAEAAGPPVNTNLEIMIVPMGPVNRHFLEELSRDMETRVRIRFPVASTNLSLGTPDRQPADPYVAALVDTALTNPPARLKALLPEVDCNNLVTCEDKVAFLRRLMQVDGTTPAQRAAFEKRLAELESQALFDFNRLSNDLLNAFPPERHPRLKGCIGFTAAPLCTSDGETINVDWGKPYTLLSYGRFTAESLRTTQDRLRLRRRLQQYGQLIACSTLGLPDCDDRACLRNVGSSGRQLRDLPDHPCAACERWLYLRTMPDGVDRLNERLRTGDIQAHLDDVGRATPLWFAAWWNEPALVQVLLRHGAKPSYPAGGDWTPFLLAAWQGNSAAVAAMLDAGADARAAFRNGYNALDLAANVGSLATVHALLDHGADPLAADNSGDTVLHQLSFGHGTQDVAIAEALLKHGADVNRIDRRRNAPLHFAAGKNKLALVKWLLAHGAGVNATGETKRTPLHEAAAMSYLEVMTALIENGADINALTDEGASPLYGAVEKGFIDAAELLLDKHADPNAGAALGVTPLHAAAQNNEPEIAELLLKHGASAAVKDKKGRTALAIAAAGDGRELEAILRAADAGK
jgi:ankyrin repeat protein